MKDEAEMSAASRGSQKPAAWAAFADDSGETGATSLNRQAVEEVAARMGWQVAALYRKPILTDEERAAIGGAIASEHGRGAFAWEATLKGLLERLG
jgi:hypothetical protein